MTKRPVLIIGPLPPPIGGARVSFKLFLDYIVDTANVSFRHFNLPVIDLRKTKGKVVVNHYLTVLKVLNALFFVPFSRSVVIFGSRNFCFSYGLVFIVFSRCFGKKCSIRFFGGRPMLALAHQKNLARALILTIFKLAKTISVQTQIGTKEFPPNLQKKIAVIPNYRPIIPITSTRTSGCDDCVKFVYVGSITKTKGIEFLVNAFVKLRKITTTKNQVELHVYGCGKEEIINCICQFDKVFHHGQVDQFSLREILPSYNVLILPSTYDNEGHPGVIIEAFMAGLPVIASSLPGICEIIEDQQNGILIQAGDNEQLVAAMLHLLHNRDLIKRMSENALKSSIGFDAKILLPHLAKALQISETWEI